MTGIFYFDSPILSVNWLGLQPKLYIFKRIFGFFCLAALKRVLAEEKLAGCLRSVYIDLSKAFILRGLLCDCTIFYEKEDKSIFFPSMLFPSSALVVIQHFHLQETFFTTKENKVLIQLAYDILFRNSQSTALLLCFLLTYSATCCKKCDFSAVTPAVFLPHFLFFLFFYLQLPYLASFYLFAKSP